MKNNKLSLAIGIPAYNEEKNIKNMLNSVLKQRRDSFFLEKIMVVLDGSTDSTFKIVKEMSKKNKIIKVVSDGKRKGKATRLNQIYKMNKSDLIGTFDADILLERDCELEIMVKEFVKSKKVLVVAGRQVPVRADSLMGRFGNASFNILQSAAMTWRNGNNIQSIQGSASILRKGFTNSFKFPKDTVDDAGYLYLMSVKDGLFGFKFAMNTRIRFRSVSSFADWRKLGARTLTYKKISILRNFGVKGLLEYRIPRRFVFLGVLSTFLKDPFGTGGAILMNYLIRLFPYEFKERKPNIWEITKSSKELVKI